MGIHLCAYIHACTHNIYIYAWCMQYACVYMHKYLYVYMFMYVHIYVSAWTMQLVTGKKWLYTYEYFFLKLNSYNIKILYIQFISIMIIHIIILCKIKSFSSITILYGPRWHLHLPYMLHFPFALVLAQNVIKITTARVA